MELEFSRRIFDKYSNTRFHENTSSGSRAAPCGRTDTTKLFAISRTRLQTGKLTFWRRLARRPNVGLSSPVMRHQNRPTISDSKTTQSRTAANFSPTASLRSFIPTSITTSPLLQTNITATWSVWFAWVGNAAFISSVVRLTASTLTVTLSSQGY